MRTLWQHCHVATMADGRYSAIEDAAIVTSAGLIEWIGPRAELAPVEADRTVDLGGAWVTPGLIDCHTHAVFGGNRSGEFEQRLQGVSYAEIAAQGGGIASTVRATRAASIPSSGQSGANNCRLEAGSRAALPIWTLDYIRAAQVAGKGATLISLQHVLPNVANLLIVQATIQFSLGILAEAGLSYVGLGAQPPTPSWGRMLAEAQTMFALAPHVAIVPGLAIVLTVLGLNLLGDGLRDLLDPRLARKR